MLLSSEEFASCVDQRANGALDWDFGEFVHFVKGWNVSWFLDYHVTFFFKRHITEESPVGACVYI